MDDAYLEAVKLFATTVLPGEPKGYQDAITSADSIQCVQAMKDEIASLEKMGTWEIVSLPEGRKPVSCKWVYRIKYNADGNISHYKARLIACGYLQIHSLDYEETYAPFTRLETIRLLFAIAVKKDWEIRQVDVKTAYLYGDLDEKIYMDPPCHKYSHLPQRYHTYVKKLMT